MSSTRYARLGTSLVLLLAACGGASKDAAPAPVVASAAPSQPASPAPPATPATPAPPAQDAPPAKRVFTQVVVYRRWVEEIMKVDVAAARAWGADRANAKLLLPTTRHVLVMVKEGASDAQAAAARKKAEGLLARLKGGADWSKVAREASDDPGSKEKGGAYPGETVEQFVQPFVDAYVALAPGEIHKELVKTQFGWHVIKKDPIDEKAIVAGYRRAKAIDLAKRLADDIAARLKATPDDAAATKRAVDEAIASGLGTEAATASSRPEPRILLVGKRNADTPADSECDRVLALAPGETTVHPRATTAPFQLGDWIILKPQALTSAPADTEDICTAAPHTLTPAQIRALIEKAQKDHANP